MHCQRLGEERTTEHGAAHRCDFMLRKHPCQCFDRGRDHDGINEQSVQRDPQIRVISGLEQEVTFCCRQSGEDVVHAPCLLIRVTGSGNYIGVMSTASRPDPVRARMDPALSAVVRAARALFHPEGPNTLMDLPAHARAISGLARLQDNIVAIQDDTNSLLLLTSAGDIRGSVVLPSGADGTRQFDDLRGNKHFKHDFEACVNIRHTGGEVLLAFGSGSMRHREHVLRAQIRDNVIAADIVPAHELYAALRSHHDFAGSELNIEAAVQVGDVLRLFNRGNGAPAGNLLPVNATVDLDCDGLLRYIDAASPATPPELANTLVYELGELDGCALSFTDAALVGDTILFVAVAELSPDVTRDGVVIGSVIGVIDNDGGRWTRLLGADATPVTAKVEGVLAGATWQDPLLLATDADDPSAASEIYEVELNGPWR